MPDNRGPVGRSTTDLPDTARQGPCRSPVFVLSASRSGSTVMRFILDSHPDLACPPETSVTETCAMLMHSWDVLENASADERTLTAETGPVASAYALAAVRATVDGIYGRYLERRGKRRWCDKSLRSHHFAEVAALLYPEARFICLYRHCMDVIASGVEACPWGLHRFGFDGFTGQHPGNSVAAIGSYWLSAAASIMAFEDKHPDACHRVRYEDLVTAPEDTAAGIFSFLGAEPVPGITQACFRAPHEGNGPGDEEIWFTGGITADSVGCGVRVPVAALTPQLRQAVNEVLEQLGYSTVDEEWNAQAGRVDVRAGAFGEAAAPNNGQGRRQREPQQVARAIGDRLRSRPGDDLREASSIWPAVAGQTVAIVVEDADGDHAELRWSFAESPDGPGADGRTGDQPLCTMIAGPATWRALLDGQANVVAEMTAGRLRCVNRRDGYRIRSDEVHAISWLLGLARVPLLRVRQTGSSGAPAGS
jgi:Sulfotransferase family